MYRKTYDNNLEGNTLEVKDKVVNGIKVKFKIYDLLDYETEMTSRTRIKSGIIFVRHKALNFDKVSEELNRRQNTMKEYLILREADRKLARSPV